MDVVLKERKVKLSRMTSEHKHKIASTHQYHNKVEGQSIITLLIQYNSSSLKCLTITIENNIGDTNPRHYYI
jgi:hypothetical protein